MVNSFSYSHTVMKRQFVIYRINGGTNAITSAIRLLEFKLTSTTSLSLDICNYSVFLNYGLKEENNKNMIKVDDWEAESCVCI